MTLLPAAPPHRDLVILTDARRMIAEASNLAEVKEIRDQGHAAIRYVKSRRDLGLDVQNDAAEIVLMAERRLGEMLAGIAKQHGARPADAGSHDVTPLSDLGISKMQSHRWQAAARVPGELFERFVQETRAAGKQLTSSFLLKLGKQQSNHKPEQSGPIEGVAASLSELIAADHRFACIYADPPWRYGNQATRAAANNHYQTMSVEEICREPVSQLTADVAHLYLWTTAGFLCEAFAVMDAWGFTYKTNIVWVKPQMGIGNYVRLSHEHLLLGIKGKTRTRGSNQKSWVEADRIGHSRKPDVFREIIEKMSDGPYLEMYGRARVAGWTVYGDQVEVKLFL